MELFKRGALELSTLLQNKEVSSEEITRSCLERIEEVEPDIKSFIKLCPLEAIQAAQQVDHRRMQGEELHLLAGVPVAVKDNISTRGIPTTCGSHILENYIPPYDAAVVESLHRAGLPIVGKTNMDEFAMGSSTENSAFFPTRNPWDRERVPGGSSGGSAAAVAAQQVPLALGSDTAGSVRQPAAFCGITGVRPTYGCVSRYGLVAFASSLDQIGVVSRSVADGAALYELIAGRDPRDSTSRTFTHRENRELGKAEETISQLVVGVIGEQMSDEFDPEIVENVRSAARFLEEKGARITEISLPLTDYALAAYYLINPAEASSNLGRYDGVRYGLRCENPQDLRDMFTRTRGEGFGPEVKRRIMLGTYALSAGYYDAYYLQALKVRTLIQRELEEAFRCCQLLLGPTTPTPPFKLGEKVDDPLQMYLSDVCTVTAALAGYPALSAAAGRNREGLPMGVQLTAAPGEDLLLFQAAHVLEQKFSPLCLPY